MNFFIYIFHHNLKEESLYTGVIAMRDAGQRNGPEVPVESRVLGSRHWTEWSESGVLETDTGVRTAVPGLTRHKR